MISGKLPNNTMWWLSADGQKIWIESIDLEQEKFKEKGYRVTSNRIFNAMREMGKSTTSKLESRKHSKAWIIKVDIMLHVYPELVEEIKRKEIEEQKKKNTYLKNKRKKKEFKRYHIEEDSIVKEDKDGVVES